MNLEVRPILSALLRNKVRAVLISLQIAITLAIVSNALFIIRQRQAKMNRPTGIDVPNLVYVWSRDLRQGSDYFAEVAVDMAALQALPGVAQATVIGSAPLSDSGNGEAVSVVDDPEAPSFRHNRNKVDHNGLATLGLKLVAGRDFTRDDVSYEGANASGFPPVGIVTQALADAIFPDGDALGKTVYNTPSPIQIIGIVERMQGPWLNSSIVERVMLQPIIAEGVSSRYLIRAAPGERDRLVAEAEAALLEVNPTRLIEVRTQEEILASSYHGDWAMARVLSAVIVLLVLVSMVGVVGLANASVSQRTKQIGTRRALGAREKDIVRYFQIENGLVTGFGVVVGALLAFALNYWLVKELALARLDVSYVACGVLALLLLGQLAVLAPAHRAARIAPSIATRTA